MDELTQAQIDGLSPEDKIAYYQAQVLAWKTKHDGWEAESATAINDLTAQLANKKDAWKAKHDTLETDSTATINDLNGQLARWKEKHEALKTEAITAVNDLNGQLAGLKEKHDALEKDSSIIIGDLSDQLAKTTKAAAAGYVTVTVNKVDYKIVGKKFHIKGNVVESADLAKDDVLLQHLVDIKSGILAEVAA